MGQIHAGDFRERVTLLTTAAPPLSDGCGGWLVGGPDTQQGVWARVVAVSTAEKLRLGQTLNSEVYRITIRSEHAANAKQRLVWRGKTMNVLGAPVSEGREYQTLLCVNGGQ